MKHTPLISVLMPVYNGEAYLREAIDSILGQTFTDFEFVIINDGSTDATKDIILSYTDPRIHYVENEINLKLIATLNKGIDLCQGKYIARMDADDISVPERLQKQFEFLENHQEVGIIGTWYQTFDDRGKTGICKYLPNHDEICFKQLYQIHLSHGTCMIRKKVLDETSIRFDKEYAHAEDYDMFTRLSQVTRLANLQFVGYLVRKHEGEVSVRFANVQQENSNRVRIREFRSLGVDITDEELRVFIQLNHQSYNEIQMPKEDVGKLLECIICRNKESKCIDSHFLEARIKDLWFNYCYNKTSYFFYRMKKTLITKIPTIKTIKWFVRYFWSKNYPLYYP